MIVKTQKVDLYKGASGIRKFTKQEMQVPYMRLVLGKLNGLPKLTVRELTIMAVKRI